MSRRAVREAEQHRAVREAEQHRADRRLAAASAWPALDGLTRQRAAMEIAAFILDNHNLPELADWLLMARPHAVTTIATGVAVHALRHGIAGAWDALMISGAADFEQATEDFIAQTTFIWQPGENDLLP